MEKSTKVSVYLNFAGNTEQAFEFYKEVFGTEYSHPFQRFGEMPPSPEQPPLPESVKNQILHVELPIYDGFVLMGSDAPKEFGFNLTMGDNVQISISTSTKDETDVLYQKLSDGGIIKMALQETFWGAYYTNFTDKFGVNWMLNCALERNC